MAALAVTHPTLLDIAKRMDPDGSIAAVVEILNETNEVYEDVVWVEGNLPTGHRTTIRTGIPTPTWRRFNQGVQPTKSRTAQITANCGMLEAYAEVDAALAALNGNTAEWRLSEDRAFIEGIGQEFTETLFYGNEGTEPEAFTGLTSYYNDRTGPENAGNIIHGGSSDTDNASIWLVVWGANTIHGIFPKGSKAGVSSEDKGQVTTESPPDGVSGGRMEIYRTHYKQVAGLAVRDWRYAVRIANIDRSALVYNAASGANLPVLMFEAMRKIPNLRAGRAAFYMDRDIMTKVDQQLASGTSSSTMTVEMVGGQMMEFFKTIPMRRVDALSGNEALVS
jgi:hypothetical protein